MKLTKNQNPHDVKVGQKWKSKDNRRKRKFSIIKIEKSLYEAAALVDYGDTLRYINLLRFGEYVKCK